MTMDPIQRQNEQDRRDRIRKRRARLDEINQLTLGASDNPLTSQSPVEQGVRLRKLTEFASREDVGIIEAVATNQLGETDWTSNVPFLTGVGTSIDQERLDASMLAFGENRATVEDVERIARWMNFSQREMSAAGMAAEIATGLIPFAIETYATGAALSLGGKAIQATKWGMQAKRRMEQLSLVRKMAEGRQALTTSARYQAIAQSRLGGAAIHLGRAGVEVGKAVPYGVAQTLGKEAIGTMVGGVSEMLLGEGGLSGRAANAAHLKLIQDKYELSLDDKGVYQMVVNDDLTLLEYMPTALYEQFVENWAEGTGRGIDEGMAALSHALRIKAFDAYAIKKAAELGVTPTTVVRGLGEKVDKFGLQGTMTEVIEEVIGTEVLAATGKVVGNEEWVQARDDFYDPENLGAMAAGIWVGGRGVRGLAGGVRRFRGQSARAGLDIAAQGSDLRRQASEARREVGMLGLEQDDVDGRPPAEQGVQMNLGNFTEEEYGELAQAIYENETQAALLEEARKQGRIIEDFSPEEVQRILLEQNQEIDQRVNKRLAAATALGEKGAKDLLTALVEDAEVDPTEGLTEALTEGLEEPEPVAAPAVVSPGQPSAAQPPETAEPVGPAERMYGGRNVGDTRVYDRDETSSEDRVDPQVQRRDAQVYESPEYQEAARATAKIHGGVVPYAELNETERIYVNMGVRQGKPVIWVDGIAGGDGYTTRPDGSIVIDRQKAGFMDTTLDFDGTPIKLTGREAIDALFLHETDHRADLQFGRSYTQFIASVLDKFFPKLRDANEQNYRGQYKAMKEAGGLKDYNPTEEEFFGEGVARTKQAFFRFLKFLADRNDTQALLRILQQDDRGFMRKMLDGLEGFMQEVIPFGLYKPSTLQQVQRLKDLVGGIEGLSEEQTSAAAGLASEFLDAWRTKGGTTEQSQQGLFSVLEQVESDIAAGDEEAQAQQRAQEAKDALDRGMTELNELVAERNEIKAKGENRSEEDRARQKELNGLIQRKRKEVTKLRKQAQKQGADLAGRAAAMLGQAPAPAEPEAAPAPAPAPVQQELPPDADDLMADLERKEAALARAVGQDYTAAQGAMALTQAEQMRQGLTEQAELQRREDSLAQAVGQDYMAAQGAGAILQEGMRRAQQPIPQPAPVQETPVQREGREREEEGERVLRAELDNQAQQQGEQLERNGKLPWLDFVDAPVEQKNELRALMGEVIEFDDGKQQLVGESLWEEIIESNQPQYAQQITNHPAWNDAYWETHERTVIEAREAADRSANRDGRRDPLTDGATGQLPFDLAAPNQDGTDVNFSLGFGTDMATYRGIKASITGDPARPYKPVWPDLALQTDIMARPWADWESQFGSADEAVDEALYSARIGTVTDEGWFKDVEVPILETFKGIIGAAKQLEGMTGVDRLSSGFGDMMNVYRANTNTLASEVYHARLLQELADRSDDMDQIDAGVERLPDLITNLGEKDYAAATYNFEQLVSKSAMVQANMDLEEAIIEAADPAGMQAQMEDLIGQPIYDRVIKGFAQAHFQRRNTDEATEGEVQMRDALLNNAELREQFNTAVRGQFVAGQDAFIKYGLDAQETLAKKLWTKHAIDLINSTTPSLLTEENTSMLREFLISRVTRASEGVPLPGLPVMAHKPEDALRSKYIEDWLGGKEQTFTDDNGQPILMMHTTSSVWARGEGRMKSHMPFIQFTHPQDMGFQTDPGMMARLFMRSNFGVKENPLTGDTRADFQMYGMPAYIRFNKLWNSESVEDRSLFMNENAVKQFADAHVLGKATPGQEMLALATFADRVLGDLMRWMPMATQSEGSMALAAQSEAANKQETWHNWIKRAQDGDQRVMELARTRIRSTMQGGGDARMRVREALESLYDTPYGQDVVRELGPEFATDADAYANWFERADAGSADWLAHPISVALMRYHLAHIAGFADLSNSPFRSARVGEPSHLIMGAGMDSPNNWIFAEEGYAIDWYKSNGYDGFIATEQFDEAGNLVTPNRGLLARGSARHIGIFDFNDIRMPFGAPSKVNEHSINMSLNNGLDIGMPTGPFGREGETGMGFTQAAKGPIRSKTAAYVKGPDGSGLSFVGRLKDDGVDNGIFEAELPAVPESMREQTAADILHHAMVAGAQTVKSPEDPMLRDVMLSMTGSKLDPRGDIVLSPEVYDKAGNRYALGAEKARRDAVQKITGRSAFYDRDVRMSLSGPRHNNPANSNGNSSYDLMAAHAALASYKETLDLHQHYVDVQSASNEQQIRNMYEGDELGAKAFVNRMGRAIHFQIDLMGSRTGLSPVQLARQFEMDMKREGKWDALDPSIKQATADIQQADPRMIRMAAKIAQQNHRIGQDLVAAGMLENAKEFYTARYWFMDESAFEAALLGQGQSMVQGGWVDPTRAGGRFKTGMGARAKQRTYDNIFDGLRDGRRLIIDNALVAQQKVAHDAAEVMQNVGFAKVLADIGALVDYGDAVPEGFEQIGSASRAFDGKFAPKELAREISAMTQRIDWREWPSIVKNLHDFNSRTKLTLLFTSLFHHQAFMRSYYYSIPDAMSEVGDLPKYLQASLRSVLGNIDGAARNLMETKAGKVGFEMVMSQAPEIAELVRAGMTLSVGLTYSQKAAWDSEWRASWIEQVIGKFGTGARNKAEQMAQWRESASSFLFNRLGLSMKAMAGILEYRHMLLENQKALAQGKITKEEIASIVANKTNDDFGGLNLRRGKQAGLLGGGARKPATQLMLRLVMLAPDWTESNFNTLYKIFKNPGDRRPFARKLEQKAYAKLYTQAVIRSQVPTVLWNLLMAGLTEESFAEGYKRRWDESFSHGGIMPRKLNFLKADITPVAKAVNGLFGRFGKTERSEGARYYFNAMGHFMDPAKWIMNAWNGDLFSPLKAKGSPLVRLIANLWSGEDWRGMTYTNWNEIFQRDPEAMLGFKTEFKKWAMNPKFEKGKAPSFVVSQVIDAMPIFMQSGVETATGESTAFEFLADMLGTHISKEHDKGGSRSRASRREGGGR